MPEILHQKLAIFLRHMFCSIDPVSGAKVVKLIWLEFIVAVNLILLSNLTSFVLSDKLSRILICQIC